MKTTLVVHLWMSERHSEDFSRKEWVPLLFNFDSSSGAAMGASYAYIGPRQCEVDVPDDFNPIAHQVTALEAEKAAALDAYQASVRRIDEQLSKLQAIEYVEAS